MTIQVNPVNIAQQSTSVDNVLDQLQFPSVDATNNSTPELGQQALAFLQQIDASFGQSTVYASNPPISTSPVDELKAQKTLGDMQTSAEIASKVLGTVSQNINTLVVKMQ